MARIAATRALKDACVAYTEVEQVYVECDLWCSGGPARS
jgi:hypothetical protein